MWIYNGVEFDESMIGEQYGFVYIITNNINGKKYIGRKYFWSKKTLPPLKGKIRKRHTISPSNWKNYWSSSKVIVSEINEYGKENFTREIISLHPDKRETNYAELAEQVLANVLEARDHTGERIFYNENILSRYYPSKKYDTQRITEHESRLDDWYHKSGL